MWSIDGKANVDKDDDSRYDELDDKNDDSGNRTCFFENIAMMEAQLL